MGGNFLVAARQISEVKYDYRSLFGYTAFHIRMTFAKQFNLSASIMRPQQFGGCLYSLRLNIKSVHPVAYFGKPKRVMPVSAGRIHSDERPVLVRGFSECLYIVLTDSTRQSCRILK